MSGFIPKEKLTAYQRWELAAFDEAEQAAANAESTAPPEDEAAIALREKPLVGPVRPLNLGLLLAEKARTTCTIRAFVTHVRAELGGGIGGPAPAA